MNSHGFGGQSLAQQGITHAPAARVSAEERMDFIRKTYGWFLLAVAISVGVGVGSFNLVLHNIESVAPFMGGFGWLGVLAVYMVLGFVFQRMLMSRSTALFGLIGMGVIEGLIFGPLLFVAWYKAGGNFQIIYQALAISGITFAGLTAYVFLTRSDFSWLRGALWVGVFLLLGVVIAAAFIPVPGVWGLAIGGFGILLFSGFILYDTSQILHNLGPGDEVMAGAMLHIDFAMLLWYVLYFLISLQGSDT